MERFLLVVAKVTVGYPGGRRVYTGRAEDLGFSRRASSGGWPRLVIAGDTVVFLMASHYWKRIRLVRME